jgi:uncharacterized phage protein (TIGR02220 family)
MEGWIKLHRKLADWEWYKKSNMVHLFLHMVLTANFEDKTWQGVTIKRGELITGRKKLSAETGISEQSIRTCFFNLQSTSEITIRSTNKYSIITICNYELYQNEDNSNNQQIPNKKLKTNQQLTTTKELKNKEVINTSNEVLSTDGSVDHNPVVKINYQNLVDYWNKRTNLNKIKVLSEKRKATVRARIKEHGKERFKEVIDKAGESGFLNGKNDREWKADFDWIMRPTNFIKILEGNYENKTEKKKNGRIATGENVDGYVSIKQLIPEIK